MAVTVTRAAPNRDLTNLNVFKETVGLDLDDESSDAVISRFITAASSMIEAATGRSFARESVTETLVGSGSSNLLLARCPIVHVTDVRFRSASEDADEFSIGDRNAAILFRAGLWTDSRRAIQGIEVSLVAYQGRQDWEVDYTAGFVLRGWGELSITVTTADVDVVGNKITNVAHGFVNGETVEICADVALPGGLTANIPLFAVGVTVDTFQLSSSLGGVAIDITSIGSGDFIVARLITLPATLEMAAIQTANSLLLSSRRDTRITQERLGDHAVSFAQGSALPETVMALLAPWTSII